MNDEIYEKVATGRDLKDVFQNVQNLSSVESYLVHVETVNGSENNFIEGSKYGGREVDNLYVTDEDMTNLKMI